MHRPGTAEGKQREPARVDSALDGDHAQRPHHLLVGDAEDAARGLVGAEAERAPKLGDRLLRRVGVELNAPRQARVASEVAE